MSAKKLADDMVAVIHLEGHFFRGFFKGFVSWPVDIYYPGRDHLDTDNRSVNSYDRERLIRMVKRRTLSKRSLEKVIQFFMKEFFDRVDVNKIKELSTKSGGVLLGKITFNQLAAANVGYAFSSK